MFRSFALVAALAASPAFGETLSGEIARTGLQSTETRLAALASPTDDERLGLGAVQFLRAIEIGFQTRWDYGLSDRTGMLPLLRLPIEENPNPKPFDPAVIRSIFSLTEAQLAKSIQTLSELPEGSVASFTVNLGSIWFDVNQNSLHDSGEDLLLMAAPVFMADTLLLGMDRIEIRFDSADAHWAAAYAHLLSGVSEFVMAYDPTGPIARIFDARIKLAEFGPPPPSFLTGSASIPDEIDMIAMVLDTFNQQPDAKHMERAHAHFLAMVDQNRDFWRLVALENDNDREWLPNAQQQSALGIALPPETGDVWLSVLSDGEALLRGEKLIPYWRTMGDQNDALVPKGGVDLKKIFLEPRPIDLVGWVQGRAAVPYLELGPLVSMASWDRFSNMLSGDAMLFALWLN